jgi:hypothetical protein
MGGFYTAYFTTLWAVFVDRERGRAMEHKASLFPFSRNSLFPFFYFLSNNGAAFQALGIHLKPQGV